MPISRTKNASWKPPKITYWYRCGPTTWPKNVYVLWKEGIHIFHLKPLGPNYVCYFGLIKLLYKRGPTQKWKKNVECCVHIRQRSFSTNHLRLFCLGLARGLLVLSIFSNTGSFSFRTRPLAKLFREVFGLFQEKRFAELVLSSDVSYQRIIWKIMR